VVESTKYVLYSTRKSSHNDLGEGHPFSWLASHLFAPLLAGCDIDLATFMKYCHRIWMTS
ncbi:MAG: hypothetical protein KUF72_19715, partial [Candidatus Thiodiazotropha sp. (ex Ctena orbiculata)]|nr:hypothetical protein [Candidatus Thiodiazotropha taylori]